MTMMTFVWIYLACFVGAYMCIRVLWLVDGSTWLLRDRLICMGFSLFGPFTIFVIIFFGCMAGVHFVWTKITKGIDWDKEVWL